MKPHETHEKRDERGDGEGDEGDARAGKEQRDRDDGERDEVGERGEATWKPTARMGEVSTERGRCARAHRGDGDGEEQAEPIGVTGEADDGAMCHDLCTRDEGMDNGDEGCRVHE